MKSIILILIIIIAKISISYPQPGTIDSTFGENGVVYLDDYKDFHYPLGNERFCFDHKHRILLTDWKSNISRYLPDGKPDESFGMNGRLDPGNFLPFPVFFSLLDDNKILIFNHKGNKFSIYKLHENGDIDTSFVNEGKLIIDLDSTYEVMTLSIQDDNKIILVGTKFTTVPHSSEFCNIFSMRFMPDGKIDSTFGVNGTIIYNITGIVGEFILLPNNNYLIMYWDFSNKDEAGIKIIQTYLIRILNNGSLDHSFGADGVCKLFTEYLIAFIGYPPVKIALQKDGKILAAGSDFRSRIDFYMSIFQLTTEGKIDSAFAEQGEFHWASRSSQIQDMKITNDGDFYLLASLDLWTQSHSEVIMHFSQQGILDTSFGQNGLAFLPLNYYYYMRIDLFSDDKISVLGANPNTSRYFLVRINNSEGSKIQEPNFANSIQIFPNPGSDYFYVNIPSDTELINSKMQVFDRYGRLILKKQGYEILTRHDVSSWSDGLYFIKIEIADKNEISKFILTR